MWYVRCDGSAELGEFWLRLGWTLADVEELGREEGMVVLYDTNVTMSMT